MNGNIASQSIVTITSTTDENYSSSDVDCLVKSWMIDYLFLSITRHFKEKNSEEFVREVRSFEGKLSQIPYKLIDCLLKVTSCISLLICVRITFWSNL